MSKNIIILEDQQMKKFKAILLLTLFLAVVATTVPVPSDNNTIIPNEHFNDRSNEK